MGFLSRWRKAKPLHKSWEASQSYELEHAIAFMNEPSFRDHHSALIAGKLNVSAGFRDSLLMAEFFGGSPKDLDAFLDHVTGRTCLDIGPCVASQIAGWDVAKERIAIEPLLEPIVAWQEANLGASAFSGMRTYARPAEELIEDLRQAIDGAIVCRNMLDHTPRWPFVLSNMAAYAALGCKLLLWSDLDHRGTADEGHYDITSDVDAFKRLVAQLGFRVLREYRSTQRVELNWGCFAERT